MLNYKNTTSGSKKYFNQDLLTAHKTNYGENSISKLQLSTPKNKSVGIYQNKIRDAKNDINQIIGEISGKSNINYQALQRIRHVNNDAVGTLRDAYSTPKRQKNTQKQFNNYDAYPTKNPLFMQSSLSNPTTDIGMIVQPQKSIHTNLQSTNFQSNTQPMNLYQQNIQLHRNLNIQIRQNNNLLKRIKYLEKQNDQLRTQLGIPLSSFKQNFTVNDGNSHNFYGSRIGNQMDGFNGSNFYNQNKPMQQNYGNHTRSFLNTSMYNPQPIRYPSNHQILNKNYDNPITNYSSSPNLIYRANQNKKTAQFGDNHSQSPTSSKKYLYDMNNPSNFNRNNPSILQVYRELQQLKDQDQFLRQKTLRILKN